MHTRIDEINAQVASVFNTYLSTPNKQLDKVKAHFDLIQESAKAIIEKIESYSYIRADLIAAGIHEYKAERVQVAIEYILANHPKIDEDIKFIDSLNLTDKAICGEFHFDIAYIALMHKADQRFAVMHPFKSIKMLFNGGAGPFILAAEEDAHFASSPSTDVLATNK